jgi:ADP-ribosylglycohydrolase
VKLHASDRAVRKANAAGGDTDTTAAIVGSIVASYGSLAGIPPQWIALVEPIPASGA